MNGKNFIFSDQAAHDLSLKLPKEEAAAVLATEPEGAGDERWRQIEKWVRTSYTLVAPKCLAKVVIAEDSA